MLERVLITGASGMLGEHVVRRLAAFEKYKLFLYRCEVDDKGWWSGENLGSAEIHFQDLTCSGAEEDLAGCSPDTVIHLAAKVGGIGANARNKRSFFLDNLGMALTVFRLCQEIKARLICVGTVCSYPSRVWEGGVGVKEVQIGSGYPEESNAAYGMAKRVALHLLEYSADFPWMYLVPTNLVGPGERFKYGVSGAHVVPAIAFKVLSAMKNGRDSVSLWAPFTRREFLSAEDCAEAIARCLETWKDHHVLNLGSGLVASIEQVYEAVRAETGFKGGVRWNQEGGPSGQMNRLVDSSVSTALLGNYRSVHSIEEMVRPVVHDIQRRYFPSVEMK